MNKVLVLIGIFLLTACSSLGHSLAELTGMSLLHDRRDSAIIAIDERVEDGAIIELYKLDNVKRNAHFNITSYNGKVLVTGEVLAQGIGETIIANIRIISGVKLVHNELTVAPLSTMASRSEDALLTIKVKDVLAKIENMPGFDATRVKVITEQKIVYLMGLVHKEEALVAAKAVQHVQGIKKIISVFEYIDYVENKNK